MREHLGADLVSVLGLPMGTCRSGQHPLVRLANLEIDPIQVDSYKAALKEEIEASIRLEPGVLTLFAVPVKRHLTQIRLFEMYANTMAYQAHLQSPHFRKYKTATEHMIKALALMETDPSLPRGNTRSRKRNVFYGPFI